MDYYKRIMSDYTNFSGRARREEYWTFQIINTLIIIVLFMFGLILPVLFILPLVYVLVVVIPSLSVLVRRLHDINLSGWWVLIKFVPWLGGIALFVMTCIDSSYGPNQFGDNPKGIGMEESDMF